MLEEDVEAVALGRLQRVTEVEQLVGLLLERGLVVAVLQDRVERVDDRLRGERGPYGQPKLGLASPA
jgi:hypothetical protein